MKTKLEMAHEFMLAMIKAGCSDGPELLERAWQYADAMQAEADKREKEEAAQRRKEIREMLNAPNTFVEREGQHFDDVEEWQPDWSQAPNWATHFFYERDDEDDQLNGYFAEDKRGISIDFDIRGFDGYGRVCSCKTFNYQGDWRNSLRKRPE